MRHWLTQTIFFLNLLLLSQTLWAGPRSHALSEAKLRVLAMNAIVESRFSEPPHYFSKEDAGKILDQLFKGKLFYFTKPDAAGYFFAYFLDPNYQVSHVPLKEWERGFTGFGLLLEGTRVHVWTSLDDLQDPQDPRYKLSASTLNSAHQDEMNYLKLDMKFLQTFQGLDARIAERRLNAADNQHENTMSGYEAKRRAAIADYKNAEYAEYLDMKAASVPADWYIADVLKSFVNPCENNLTKKRVFKKRSF